MIKFWRWLHKYSERKILEYCPPYCNYQCQNCGTWSKERPPLHVEITDIGYDITCGFCRKTTVWNALTPAPFPISPILKKDTTDE